ncbi:hypothetical protein QBC34DRAFT_442386 [Podospora aff. communis PSN243]|uniref:Uncharacterized protein n=1 Tax=Podospora aff. communis PSN243 TaxID=3040156 RepID=A0AAV9G8A2_9PEZI|nr:hypothetical protein QBC34DRAFT_442386 [Podospora aff. communis PSN243]
MFPPNPPERALDSLPVHPIVGSVVGLGLGVAAAWLIHSVRLRIFYNLKSATTAAPSQPRWTALGDEMTFQQWQNRVAREPTPDTISTPSTGLPIPKLSHPHPNMTNPHWTDLATHLTPITTGLTLLGYTS